MPQYDKTSVLRSILRMKKRCFEFNETEAQSNMRNLKTKQIN